MIKLVLFLILLVFILFLALNPEHIGDKELFKNDDKIKHVLAFLALSILLFDKAIEIKNIIKICFLVFIAFGIEFFQYFLGREASVLDFVFSSIGIIVYFSIKKYYQKISL